MKRVHPHFTRSSVRSSVNKRQKQSQQDQPNGIFSTLPSELIKKIYGTVERARHCVGPFLLVWRLIRCQGGDRVFSFRFRELGDQGMQAYEAYEALQQIVEASNLLTAFPMNTSTGHTFFSAKIPEGELQIEKFKTFATVCTKNFVQEMNFVLEGSIFVHGTWQDVDPGANGEGDGPVVEGVEDNEEDEEVGLEEVEEVEEVENEEDEEDEEVEEEEEDEEDDEVEEVEQGELEDIENPKITFQICTEVDYRGYLNYANKYFHNMLKDH